LSSGQLQGPSALPKLLAIGFSLSREREVFSKERSIKGKRKNRKKERKRKLFEKVRGNRKGKEKD